MLILLIKITEFYIQESSLNLVEPAVQSLVVVNVLFPASIVANGSYDISKLIIIRCNGSGIPQCTQVFPGIKTVPGSIAQ